MKKIYLCPGTNPNHWAFKLKPKESCIKDYEHGIVSGSRTRTTYECSTSEREFNATFTTENRHECSINMPYDAYGAAIDHCMEDDSGRLWAGNGEYGTLVKFCPECGFKGDPLK